MITPESFYETLIRNGCEFFTGVPDSLLKPVCAYILDHAASDSHIIAANEGNALAIGIGYHLSTGGIPLIYLQNSGLGNVVNPLLSLADEKVYSIPALFLIGWRGEPGMTDEPQHAKQGEVTLDLLDTMGIPYELFSQEMLDNDSDRIVDSVVKRIKKSNSPRAIVVRKGAFSKYELQSNKERVRHLSREQAIKIAVSCLYDRDIVVSTTGMASRELFEYRSAEREGHEKDFLTVGGMGHANQIALGIALQKADRQVFCFDGDGGLMMHLGSAIINGEMGLKNYKHIVLNNCAHDSVGGQPTAIGHVDMVLLANSVGYRWVKSVHTKQEVKEAVSEMRAANGPAMLEIHVSQGSRKSLGRPTISPIENKKNFMKFLAE